MPREPSGPSRGGTGRVWLWVTLCAYLNIQGTFITLMVVFPLVVIFLWGMFPEPIYYFGARWFGTITFVNDESTERGHQRPFHCQVGSTWTSFMSQDEYDPDKCWRSDFNSPVPSDRSWFLFVPFGSLILVLTIWFWSPIITWWSKKNNKIFFDKLKRNFKKISWCFARRKL